MHLKARTLLLFLRPSALQSDFVCAATQARCYLRLGEWQLAMQDRLDNETIPQLLSNFQRATQSNQHSYNAWHAWAVMNFRIIQHFKAQKTLALTKASQSVAAFSSHFGS